MIDEEVKQRYPIGSKFKWRDVVVTVWGHFYGNYFNRHPGQHTYVLVYLSPYDSGAVVLPSELSPIP